MTNTKKIFSENLVVVNIGVRGFYESLIDQNVKSIHVDWKPSGIEDKRVLDILSKIL